jgi:DNA integrity scanning protein DisA with diadenylate cyclase activity
MTRLDRVIKGFNDYDNLVKQLIERLDEVDGTVAEYRVNKIRDEVSLLVGELKRYGCRRRDR